MAVACQSLCVQPYNQGWLNIRNGFRGERDIPGDLNGRIEKISLFQSISSIAVGFILCIPVINTIVLNILKNIRSQFVFGTMQVRGSIPDPIQIGRPDYRRI